MHRHTHGIKRPLSFKLQIVTTAAAQVLPIKLVKVKYMYQVKIMLPIHGFSEQDPLSTTHSDKENIARIANAVQCHS